MIRPNTTRRRGFTLIEIVAALSISVILLSAVYGAFLLYARVTQTAQRPIDQAQVARAVLRQMSTDLRSLVYRPPETATTDAAAAADESSTGSSSTSGTGTGTAISGTSASGTGTGTGTGTTSQGGTGTTGTAGTAGTAGTSTVVGAVDQTGTAGQVPSITSANQSLGIVGDATTLVLHISRPDRGLAYGTATTATTAGARSSDLLSISYFLAERSGGGLPGLVGEQYLAAFPEKESDGHPVGLARLEGDRLAIEHADVQSDEATLAQQARVIAREIVMLQFRYYDGTAWVTTWDTASQGRLPHAVEVTIGYRPPKPRHKPGERSAIGIVQPVTEIITHVIDVPLSGSYAAVQTQ